MKDQRPREDYLHKFEEPYADLLDAGVDFYAALGNHDNPRQVDYAPFNMKGERYYSFAPPEDVLAKIANRVEFFALDTTNPDSAQLRWLDERLGTSKAEWKICFFHHPLYTSGRYRAVTYVHRRLLEPLLVRHGVDVVLSGHEHIYQRSRLQEGIMYFVSGAAGSVRRGDGTESPLIARSYSQDLHFLLVEIDRDTLHFQAISRTGITIDAGTLSKDDPVDEDVRAVDRPVLSEIAARRALNARAHSSALDLGANSPRLLSKRAPENRSTSWTSVNCSSSPERNRRPSSLTLVSANVAPLTGRCRIVIVHVARSFQMTACSQSSRSTLRGPKVEPTS